MVVFTCNNCGDSLQKPKVEKHYATICKGLKSLTCVDCFKDFKNDEYVVHIKCITEEERYAAKGSIPGGVVKKGEVKQQSWTEMIQSVVSNVDNPSKIQKVIFNIITNADNVPRKKNKFMNFIKSTGGYKIDTSDIEGVWKIIEQHREQKASENSNVETVSINEEQNISKSNSNDDTISAVNGLELTKKDSKKKKKSKSTIIQENNETQIESKSDNMEYINNGEPPKKKKKSKLSESLLSNEIINTDTTNEKNSSLNEDLPDEEEKVSVNRESPKTKKKKSKNVEKENSEVESKIEETTENSLDSRKKKKKAKLTEENISNGNVNDTATANTEVHKKKKQKSEMCENDENDVSATPVEDTTTTKKRKSKVIQEKAICEEETQTNVNSTDSITKKKRKSKDTEVNPAADASLEPKKVKMIKTDEEIKAMQELQQTENSLSNTNATHFSFTDKILEIVKSKINISVESLQKKVLNAYAKCTGNELTAKVIKSYNKKLKKIEGIDISENRVKLN